MPTRYGSMKSKCLAREYSTQTNKELTPIILSHHMLPGLLENHEKMSKSIESSAIFMEDTEDEVKRKINKGFGPPQRVEANPILEYTTYIALPYSGEFVVERDEANGGSTTYKTAEHLHEDFRTGELHPSDLKAALIKALSKILEPVREHFKTNREAKDLLAKVKFMEPDLEVMNPSHTMQSYKVSR